VVRNTRVIARVASEEPIYGEGDQRQEHERPQHEDERQGAQGPQEATRSPPAPRAQTSPPAEPPPLEQRERVCQRADEQREDVQGHFEVLRRERVKRVGYGFFSPFLGDALTLVQDVPKLPRTRSARGGWVRGVVRSYIPSRE
jgi:hypothetical protein